MRLDLSGKTVLVTGASRGIGRAVAEAMAASGARVAVHCSREREDVRQLARSMGNGASVFTADLSRPSSCARLFRSVLETFGGLDVLVNNAGVAIESPLDKDDSQWLTDWNRTLQVNLTAAADLCRRSVRHFQAAGGGRIINIASRAAFRGDTVDYLAYAASKGGLVSLTRSLARGYGKDNIKAFLVAPGFVKTEMAQAFFDRYGEEIALADIALPRLTEPGDIAPLVVFLASGAGDHATGGTFDINAASYVH
ncbi:MAG: SDR family oxidoreductase [Acidobacteriota bacterium]|jgi:NAD(P)-dependent dehydrogenase (short-subunit alcohol dehydrogenase family)|nr:SDR family oxidoreductase [Acidobacteriota bacterium]